MLTFHEMMLSLFPAAACFIANLVLYDYLQGASSIMTADYRLLINFLVVFFGFSAMTVLLNSEYYGPGSSFMPSTSIFSWSRKTTAGSKPFITICRITFIP